MANLYFIRMIRTADHRAAGDVDKTHFARSLTINVESFGRNKLHHWQVPQRGLKILAKRENVAARRAKVFHGGEKFLLGFAEAQHQS